MDDDYNKEAVHEIRSWRDLKNRLDSDRRCYAFFHPRMPGEPLISRDNVRSLAVPNVATAFGKPN